MPVTKQTYTINANHTRVQVAAALRSALIDAGLMTEWFDSFSVTPAGQSQRLCQVLRIEHDSTKAYGTSFYYFVITDTLIGVALATNGWKVSGTAPINIPTGSQYLDWHTLPADMVVAGNNFSVTDLFTYSTTSNLFIDRFTSGSDSKQSWFVLRQPSTLARSQPFSFLHKDTALHPWLDLSKGCISGLSRISALVTGRVGIISFRIEENLRRCLSIGSVLRGNVSGQGNSIYHNLQFNVYSYYGLGSQNAAIDQNILGQVSRQDPIASAFPLPVGQNSANPAYTTDYVPICSDLPWSYYTPTRLAGDFGICMRYEANDLALGSRIIVQSTINEWEVLNFANNANINDGASSSFVARVI